MNTFLTKSIQIAADIIKAGGVVAFPTETVYGLGADIFNPPAIAKIFTAKGRPSDNPLIAHIGDFYQINLLADEVTPQAQKFIDSFFPGALTVVLPKTADVPLIATANLQTIGIRMPQNKLAREFLYVCKTPLVAPSANLSGRPSPTNWEAVYEDLDGKIDCILQGDVSEIGLESTVVDCTGRTPLVLRTGAITLADLQSVVPETRLYRLEKDEKPKSPGLKHKHYSPNAKIRLIADFTFQVSDKAAYIGLTESDLHFEMLKICGSVEDYAHSVFDFFRQCDREGIETIYCQIVEEQGIGTALMDRLRRASEN